MSEKLCFMGCTAHPIKIVDNSKILFQYLVKEVLFFVLISEFICFVIIVTSALRLLALRAAGGHLVSAGGALRAPGVTII